MRELRKRKVQDGRSRMRRHSEDLSTDWYVPWPELKRLEGRSLASFGADIRPLFRPEDVEEMSWAFDLSSYEEVKANAEAIYERLEDGTMPCDGPWGDEQVKRFRDWIDAGAPA